MMISNNYNYFNTIKPEPMQIDFYEYNDTCDLMDVDAIFTDNDTDTEPMDIELPRKKRRYSDISDEEKEANDEVNNLYPPSLKKKKEEMKKERFVRKAKRSTRHVMVVPAFVYFVL